MNSDTALIRAILRGDVAGFEALVTRGADVGAVVGADRWNMLHRALVVVSRDMKPSLPLVRRLIELGVEVDARDRYGWTPLHFAARAKHVEIVKALLDAGAEVDPVNRDGATPLRLTFVSKPHSAEVVSLLLERGADPDRQVGRGATVRELAETVCHGPDRAIVEIFERHRPPGQR